MSRTLLSILFLMISNVFMTFAWYGHLQFEKWGIVQKFGLPALILFSWLIALAEYSFMIPANRLGHINHGGSFSIFELKTIQELISLSVFLVINTLIFNEKLQWNHVLAFALILLAVWIAFKK